jgi:mRNA interferase RelE/StbE
MAAYRVEFTRSARKEFERLPAKVRTKTVEALSLLSQNPFSELLNVKKLKGSEGVFRFCLGDYRVLYEVRKERLIVLVIKIGHRREVYLRK